MTEPDPLSRATIAKQTVSGLVIASIGVLLIFRAPEGLGASALYIGTAMVGLGFYAVNKKLMTSWMLEVREFIPFLRGR